MKFLRFLPIAAAWLLCGAPASAQEDMFSSGFETDYSTAPLRQWPTPFAKELAKRLDVPLEKLEKLEKKGFGRTEMISFVEISRKSSKTWEDLVKQREKGTKLREMAKESGIEYNKLFRESRALKAEVEKIAGEPPKPESPGAAP